MAPARALVICRARLGLTQVALAAALDIHRITVAKYEAGEDPIPRLVALAVEALERRAAEGSKQRRPA
jgi:transcriptional regulator with XRE-family HTH domain